MKNKILIIEDDINIRGALEDFLKFENFEVIGVADGVEGLEILESNIIPNIILLDLYMPKMNGKDFLDQLEIKFPELIGRVLIMTASAPSRHPDEISSSSVLMKPFDIDLLLTKIKEISNTL